MPTTRLPGVTALPPTVVHVSAPLIGCGATVAGTGMKQEPLTQAAPPVQTTPHPPQLFESVCVLISQPLTAARSQSAKPLLHTRPQLAAVQAGVAFARVGQTVPQPPQLFTLVCVLISQPSAATR